MKVDLTYNNISRIDLPTVEIWTKSRSEPRNVIVSIENNPIRCDCRLYDLLRYLEGRLHPNVLNAFHLKLGKLKCDSPSEFRDVAVTNLKSKTLKCDASDPESNEAHCPDKCKCYMRPEDNAYLVNCAYMGLTEAPAKIETPADYRVELNLTGNMLTKMPALSNPGYENLTVLALGHNRISRLLIGKIPHNLKVCIHSISLYSARNCTANFIIESSCSVVFRPFI